jgi:uncharacterized protein DUF6786
MGTPTFAEELAFLARHVETLELADGAGARVALVPAYQGRVMTSTAGGAGGLAHGWVNHALVASRAFVPHINAFGGEDRLWLGPEGGQFSLFFAPGAPFELAHWQTPAPLDSEPFELVEAGRERARFRKRTRLVNRAGSEFELEIEREIRLRALDEALAAHGAPLARGLRGVAFESRNTLVNAGPTAWTRERGLVSIWTIGMFRASPRSTLVLPFRRGSARDLGPVVNDAYFGRVPPERLRVDEAGGVVLMRGDARQRGKIGLGPARARDVLASFDAAHGVLTLVGFSLPEPRQAYVNSLWELQDEPFAGDVVNGYNDGPNDGPAELGVAGFGAFYELESSSPALALAPGAAHTHVHGTLHLEGDIAGLEEVARATLGVGLEAIAG